MCMMTSVPLTSTSFPLYDMYKRKKTIKIMHKRMMANLIIGEGVRIEGDVTNELFVVNCSQYKFGFNNIIII